VTTGPRTDAEAVRYTQHGSVRLAYETFGDLQRGEPLLLIMGLDWQMLWWDDRFCQALVDRGFTVVRFDNRDAGLSTHFASPELRTPWRAWVGLVPPAYTLRDMVDDGLAVLDAVGWSSAHLLGASLGGVLAQATALLHPERVRSVTSLAAAPAGAGQLRMLRYLRLGRMFGLARALRRGYSGAQEVDGTVAAYQMLAGDPADVDQAWVRATARRSLERAPQDPAATQRHLSAGRGVRLPPLASLQAPLLAISGERDPIIKPAAGRATARLAPHGRFVSFRAMGHGVPPSLWPQIVDEVAAVAGIGRGRGADHST
jgi:pimeloyl-ACP methyl ester carboxylesterase